MPGGATWLWALVISAVVMAGTALPMVMSSATAESGGGRGDVRCPDGKPEVKYGLTCAIFLKHPDATCDMVFDMFKFSCCDDCAESTGDAAPIEVAQFAAAEEAVTPAEAASGAVDVARAGVADDPPALKTTSTQQPPAKSPPKTLLPPPPSPRPPQAPPPSPETLLEKQKRLEKEAEMLEQERQKLQQEHTQLKQAAESIRQRQRNLTIALQVDLCSMNSTFNVAPFCPYFYSDSEPSVVGFDDRAYEINFTLGLRKEDLSFSISNNALRSEWGNGASVSEGVGNVLQIIGRTANVNMDVGIARAVQFYNDADWDKGLNTTHSDGHLRIRVARRSSANRPMWSTWQIPGHLPKSQLDRRFYDISERLKVERLNVGREGYHYHVGVVLPAMQWFAQAPERALAWWFNEYKQIEVKESYRTVTIKRNSFALSNDTKTACQNAISTLTAAKETCASRMAWGEFLFSNHRLKCNGGWFESIADFDSANAVVEAIEEHLSKTIKNIEESGGYNIIVRTQILDGTMYKIDKNGVQYRQQTLPSFGNWCWSKNVKITRQDGLDVIFIPIKTET